MCEMEGIPGQEHTAVYIERDIDRYDRVPPVIGEKTNIQYLERVWIINNTNSIVSWVLMNVPKTGYILSRG